MKKILILLLMGLCSCYDFDYVEPTEELHYRKPVVDSVSVPVDTVRQQKCAVGL